MEKKCFIVMPTSEPDGYAQGHFSRVYDYIIVPACRLAGLSPTRADNPDPNDSPLDLIKNIIESDLAICDLSTKNQYALYVLAVRQSLNLPVTLVKDLKTQISFDTTEFNQIEYDESLRIDTVQKEVETLREALEKTFADKTDIHSLLSRLDIGPGRTPQPSYTFDTYSLDNSSEEVVEQEPVEPKEAPLPIISPLPDYVGDPLTETDIEKLKVGGFIFHMNHGKGEIKTLRKISRDKIAEVLFESGSKILVLGTSGFWRKITG